MIQDATLQIMNWMEMGPVLAIGCTVIVLVIADVVARLLGSKKTGIGLIGSFWITVAGCVWALIWGISQILRYNTDQMRRLELFPVQGYQIQVDPVGFVTEGTEGVLRPAWDAGTIIIDGFGVMVAIITCVILIAAALMVFGYLKQRGGYRFEIYPLMLLSGMGMLLLGLSKDLLTTFIAIEILSLPLYVLCGMKDDSVTGKESSLKYFLLGAFASGFFIYGAALIYGEVGHLNYDAIPYYLSKASDPGWLLITGLALVLIGFFFKLAIVPFHAWVPDVYQGAPTPITGFMSTGVKLAIFAAIFRFIMGIVYYIDSVYWVEALTYFAIATMIVGNLFALHQMSAKRLLAYSAIAHTGYLTLALLSQDVAAAPAMWIYLIAYCIAGIGAFAMISFLAPKGQDDLYLDEMHQLAAKAPLASAVLGLMLLSMGGFPLTAGFIGKLALFTNAWANGLYGLVILAILMSAVGFYYYLRFLLAMYIQPKAPGAPEPDVEPKMPLAYLVTAVVASTATIVLGVLPGWLYDFSQLGNI